MVSSLCVSAPLANFPKGNCEAKVERWAKRTTHSNDGTKSMGYWVRAAMGNSRCVSSHNIGSIRIATVIFRFGDFFAGGIIQKTAESVDCWRVRKLMHLATAKDEERNAQTGEKQ